MRALVIVVAILGGCGGHHGGAVDAPGDVAADVPVDSGPPPNRVFVTRDTFDGSLGGVAGADAKCSAAAAAAGLDGTYVALLSTSTMNAIDRLSGSRGWARVDGVPFVDTAAALFPAPGCDPCSALVLAPQLDEYGHAPAATPGYEPTAYAWTGTNARGMFSTLSCADWTSTAGNASGSEMNTVLDMFNSGALPCTTPLHLYCFEVGRSVAIGPRPRQGRIAFVSTPRTAPGLAGLDARCAADAAAAGLPGTYLAAAATSTTTIPSRFTLDARPWVRIDGAVVADGASIFTTTISYIHQRADGSYVTLLSEFGSGTEDTSSAGTSQYTCNDWASFASTDTLVLGNGDYLAPGRLWDYAGGTFATCDVTFGAMCLQQ